MLILWIFYELERSIILRRNLGYLKGWFFFQIINLKGMIWFDLKLKLKWGFDEIYDFGGILIDGIGVFIWKHH